MWAGMSCDVGARWWEFGPPYNNLGRPRQIWADIVLIWAGGSGMWASISCDVGARWWEFGPPYSNVGRPRQIWADIVLI